jgi:hypothetical protein
VISLSAVRLNSEFPLSPANRASLRPGPNRTSLIRRIRRRCPIAGSSHFQDRNLLGGWVPLSCQAFQHREVAENVARDGGLSHTFHVLLLSFLLLLLGSVPAFACQLTPRTTAPLVMQDGVPTLCLMVNGQPARFVLDTGAGRTVVSPDAVRRLGIPLDPWVGTTLEGVGGLQRHQNAVPQSIDLNGVPLRQAHLGGAFSLAVATLPVSAPVDGLLGRDLLDSFDLDIDLPRLRLTLYTVWGCTGAFLPWSERYRGATAISGYRDALVFFSFLDAHPLRTIVDTGAAASLLTASGAVRAGFQTVARDPYARLLGVGPRRVAARLHQFDTLSVAGVISPAPRLLVTDLLLAPLVDLVLGDEWLLSHRVWLSFATRQVFFASP